MYGTVASADTHLHSIRAVRVGCDRLIELPRARLMTIGPVEKCPRRTNLDAVAALRTVQPAAVCTDDRVDSAISGFDGFFTHPLIADPCAAFAQDAALRIVSHDRRKKFLGLSVLAFGKALFD